MNYNDLAKELKKNTDVVESTFEKNNLKLLRFRYRPYGEDDADCVLLIEFSADEGLEIPNSLFIKVNLYDDNDDIYLTDNTYINAETFSGYDTKALYLTDDSNALLRAKAGRIFVTR